MILGIDPGKNGAMAFLSSKGICVVDMPNSIPAIVEAIRKNHDPQTDSLRFAVIEDVGAMTYIDASGKKRGQGAQASFNFGFGAGVLHGVLAALGIRVYSVKPATWKLAYGLSSNKDESRALAVKKFPNLASQLARKKDDGRAEAALLALFGEERFV